MGVLGETILVGRRATGKVNIVTLGHAGPESTWVRKDIGAVVGEARAIDVETCEDLGG